MAHDSIFELAQKLKISPRRLRLKLDLLAFRQPPENPREKLREILKNGEKQNDGNKVRIQVCDGYVRAHAQDLVRRNLGIVDTSFNTESISLSPDQLLLLVDDALSNETGDQKNKYEIKELLNQVKSEWLNAQAEDEPVPDPWTIFKEAFAKGAGGALGQKTVDLGITILGGGIAETGQILSPEAVYPAEPDSDRDA